MKIERIIEILEKHQEWRRDQNVPPKTQMQSPIELGTAIDYAIEELKKLRTEDKEQTAVEYLLEYCARENWSIPFDVQHTAKEMEKKQIIDAWMDDRFPLDKEWVQKCAEQYYNDTYGGNNEQQQNK